MTVDHIWIPFDRTVVINEVITVLQVEAEHKHLYIRKHVDPDIPKVAGDPIRLKQILLNLVKNAIKFTEQGGVTIKALGKAEAHGAITVFFSVEDTGIGIDNAKLTEIFKEFSQADASTTRIYGGTGLGLAISKKLVEVQKGSIQVKSSPGKGSKFSFTIPYKQAKQKEEVSS